MNNASTELPRTTHRRLWLTAFVVVVICSAGRGHAAEWAPISIDAAVPTGDASARGSPLPRQPSSHNSSIADADYTFDVNGNEIAVADDGKAREIANRVREVPTLRVVLGGANARHVDAVRDALIVAGIPSFKIQMSALGDAERRDDARVAVLLID